MTSVLSNVRDIQQHSTTIPSFGKNKNNITINSLQSSIVDNTLESSSGSLIFTSTNDSENYFTTSTSNTTITSSSINNIIEKDSLLPNPFITTVTTDNSNINYNPQIESQELVIVSDNDLAIITATESQLESVEVGNSLLQRSQLFESLAIATSKMTFIKVEPESDDEITTPATHGHFLRKRTKRISYPKDYPSNSTGNRRSKARKLRQKNKHRQTLQQSVNENDADDDESINNIDELSQYEDNVDNVTDNNDDGDNIDNDGNDYDNNNQQQETADAQLVRHDLRSRKVLDKQSNKQISVPRTPPRKSTNKKLPQKSPAISKQTNPRAPTTPVTKTKPSPKTPKPNPQKNKRKNNEDREWRPDSESDPENLSDQGSTAGPKSTLKTQTRTTSTTTSKSVTAKQSTPSVNLRPSNPIRTPPNQLSKDNGGTKRGTRVKRKEIVNKELSGVDNNDIEKIEIEQQFSITSDTNTMELVDAEAYDSPEASLPKSPTTTRKTSTSSPERLIKSRRRSTVVINELDNNEFEEEKETIPVESPQDNVTPKKSRMAATKKSSNKGVRSRRGGKTKSNINTTTEVAVIPNKETQIEQTTSSPSQSDYDDYDVVKISAENPNALTNVIKSVRRGRGGKTKGNIDSTTEVAVIPNNETQIEQTTPSSSQSDYDDPDVVKISAENPDALAGAIRALTFQNYDIVHTSANIIPIIQPQTTSIPRSIRVKPSPSSSLSSSPPSTIKSNRPKTSPSPNVNSSAWDDNHWQILKYTYLEIRNNYIEKGKSGIHNEDVYKEVIKSFLNIRPQFEESEIRVRMIALETVEIEKQGKRNTERRGSIESSSSKNSRFSATRYNSAYSNMRNTHNNPRKRKKIVKADLTEDDDLDDNSEVMAEGSKRRRGLDSDSISDVNTTGQNTPPRAKFSSLFGWFGKRTTDNASQISASDIAAEQNEKLVTA
ncbi:425_t:CDS:10 [Entrophospora sp. SA101]|nr:425_t:CDS:10 [Entrophospora sp. SA101]